MNEKQYLAAIHDLPRLHPAHPYQVSIMHARTRKYLHTMHVRAASPDRARLAAKHYYQQYLKKPGETVYAAQPDPMMPVEMNQYWGSTNRSNPTGLKLHQSCYAPPLKKTA